jgi:hypothetical protein
MRSTTSIRRGSIGSVLSSEALRRSMYSSIALAVEAVRRRREGETRIRRAEM